INGFRFALSRGEFARLTEFRESGKSKVKRAALEKMHVLFQSVDRGTGAQAVYPLFDFAEEQVDDIGEILCPDFIAQFADPVPVNHGLCPLDLWSVGETHEEIENGFGPMQAILTF